MLSLELEIKSLLEEFHKPEVVAEKLEALFADQKQNWSQETVHEFCRFLINCGLYQNLIRFCLKNALTKKISMPWAYFTEALVQGLPDLEEDVVKFVVMGIDEDGAEEQVALAHGAERFIKKSQQWKTDRRIKRQKFAALQKEQYLEQLLTLRTQQLYEQEKLLLSRLQRMFPGDHDILEEVRTLKERYALDILSRRSHLSRGNAPHEPPASAETVAAGHVLTDAFIESAKIYPDLAFDFAVAADMMEESETSLAILESIELDHSQVWFYLEVKLRCRRFLEVLQELSQLETALASEPETFFATAYLRAQAYWGLEQKHIAIEILENILAARPQYRASSALLDMWRTQ